MAGTAGEVPSAIDRAIVLAIGLIQRNPTLSLSVRLLCHPEVLERSGAFVLDFDTFPNVKLPLCVRHRVTTELAGPKV
eukprot:m.202560 g.202560  ORF g.202560 m.202560 type:complete len:78 (+) comp15365_c2_seq1:7102-7335(+)